jgi:DNA-binding response OmpR family regulator
MRTVLVIEDDAAIRQGLTDALAFAGFAVHQAATGPEGLELAIGYDCDLVLLDLVLPGLDGLALLRELRNVKPALPVIVLTARGLEADRVQGLKLGADDYVVKPFSVRELLARVQAVLRRTAERPLDVSSLALPGGLADLERREVRLDEGPNTPLTDLEVQLLRYLAANRGRAISRDELLARVWRLDPTGLDTRTVDMAVMRLREKLGDDGTAPALLLTVRGKGYMLAAEAEAPQ